jgi:hypothetical protein
MSSSSDDSSLSATCPRLGCVPDIPDANLLLRELLGCGISSKASLSLSTILPPMWFEKSILPWRDLRFLFLLEIGALSTEEPLWRRPLCSVEGRL